LVILYGIGADSAEYNVLAHMSSVVLILKIVKKDSTNENKIIGFIA